MSVITEVADTESIFPQITSDPSKIIEAPLPTPAVSAQTLPPLQESIGEVKQCNPRELYPNIGQATLKLFVDVRRSKANPNGIIDGKVVADAPPIGGYDEMERRALEGQRAGRHPLEIFRSAVRRVPNYEVGILRASKSKSLLEFAMELRKHQERTVADDGRLYTIRDTSDGRFRREDVYPHDALPIARGYAATGNVSEVVDIADILARETLKYGYPFNGIRLGKFEDSSESLNYFAGRSQRPTLFAIVRLLGEHYGDEAYAHPPYLQAMERLWHHFNPGRELLERMPRGQFHAYQRGVITPEGWPFSVYGDDTNNGRPYREYRPRLEMAKDDLESADEAAERAAPEDRDRVRGDVLVNIQAAAEFGRDFTLDRLAGGKNLSYIDTTNIILPDLQYDLIHAADTLAHAYRIMRIRAEARGDHKAACEAYVKEVAFIDDRTNRFNAVKTYCVNPKTGIPHDLELIGPSASYDSLRTYRSYRRTAVVSTAIMGKLALTTDPQQALSIMRVAKKELLGPGGLAATNNKGRKLGQWDGEEAWMVDQVEGVEAAIIAAATLREKSPEVAEESLEFGEQIQNGTLEANDQRVADDGVMPEHWNAFIPMQKPIIGEYEPTPNLAMDGEGVIELSYLNVRERSEVLAARAAGKRTVASA